MDRKVAKVDAMIAGIAAKQYGVVSASQLGYSGIGEGAIRARLALGRLHRVHRGVYAVGHPVLSSEGRFFAAVLAVGRGPIEEAGSVLDHWRAAISHRSAACHWNLLQPTERPTDVIVGGDSGRAQRLGIRVHRSVTLALADVTLRRGIPVTTPARTISDLHRATSERRPGAVSVRELRRAIRQANVLGLSIGEESGKDRTRSDLERDFLRLCRQSRLPLPEVNIWIGRYLVDFFWRERRLVVETDGYFYHRGKVAFQDDRDRDLELKRLGYEVLRISERQLNEDSNRVGETLAAVLGHPWQG